MLILHTNFQSDPWGGGAGKRSAQIKELIDDLNTDCDHRYFEKGEGSSYKSFRRYFKALIIIKKFNKLYNFKSFRRFSGCLKRVSAALGTFEQKYKGEALLLLWESTSSDNFYLPVIVREKNGVTIGLPHNIESLVPDQYSYITGSKSPVWFKEELKLLSICKYVFTISREESWLLRLYGINAHYLPYYPPKPVCAELLKIREKRLKNSYPLHGKKQILMLGDINNSPTRAGMESRIALFEKNSFDSIQIIIVGYHTEELNVPSEMRNINIKIAGAISNNELFELMVQVDAVIIHQSATTGALTKIPEILVAGIPLIINIDAARSYYSYNGVYLYDSDDEFIELLNKPRLTIPEYPEFPIHEVEYFSNVIKKELVRQSLISCS